MAEYRTIRMTFWTDPYIEGLGPEAKLLYLYLFTSPHTNNLGMLEISRRKIAFETGLTEEQVNAAVRIFEHDGKAMADGQKIWLTRFIKHQTMTSPKLTQALRKMLPSVDSEPIRCALCERYPHIFDGSDTNQMGTDTLSIPYGNGTDGVCIHPGELEFGIGSLNLELEGESNTNFKPSGVVADAPTPAGIPAGAREEQLDPTLTEEPQAETQAEDDPSPAPAPKPKRTHDDHRPKDCPPEAWKLYLQISRGFHTDKAEQLGARAPFSESKVIEGAKVMDTLIRLRGRTEDEVIAVLGWSTEDEFWSQNLRSMKALLRPSRSNGELKYTNVLHAMDRAIERKIEREMAARAMQ